VLLSIFIFGGDSIRGFMFALIVGVIVGTYSSLFIATPIMYDFIKKKEDKGLTKKIKEEPQEKTKTKSKKK
jgi:SecD/SecF fusion protein